MESASRVSVVGSANIDLIMKTDRLPKPGETVSNAVLSRALGGKGANQAAAVARSWKGASPNDPADGHVVLVASVGRDDAAEEMITTWQESGIDTSAVVRSDATTGHASIWVGEGAENSIVVAPGANDTLRPESIDYSVFDEVNYILLQFEIPVETVDTVLRFARDRSITTVWNVAPMKVVDHALLERASVVIVNEHEAAALTGIEVTDRASAEKAALALRQIGPDAIVTLGPHGSILAAADRVSHVEAYPVEAVDTTAAGDTYCGCLVTALAEGHGYESAARFASAGAALAVARLGALPSVPWRNEIDSFLTARG